MSVNNEEKNIEIVESEVLETELSEKEKESVSVKSMEIPVSELLGEKTGVEEKKEPSEREKELSEKGKKSSEKKKFKLSSGALSKVFSLSNILLGLRLCVIVAAVVFALAAVNYFTSPVIKGNEEEKGNVARAALVPDATSFSLYEGDIPESGRNVSEIYVAEQNGDTIAYCVGITTAGFGGDIDLVVAIRVDMSILGIKVISHSETVGIGASALEEDAALLPQFSGLPASSVDNVTAVSGATVTSNAVKSCVEEAAVVVNALVKGADSE